MEEFWARVNAEPAWRQLFPSVTPGEETARLLRSLYFMAESRAELNPWEDWRRAYSSRDSWSAG